MNTSHTCTALTALAVLCSALAFGEPRTYTSAQTVADTITGDDAIVVNVPNAYATTDSWDAASGWTGIVEFTGNNSFTGDVTIESGAVKVSSATALGSGRIKMHPHTAIIVAVANIATNIIDRIDVVEMENESDKWVSFQVEGEGFTNDIDFSSQEHLFLSAPRKTATYENDGSSTTLNGTFTPYANTYKFGYNFVHWPRTSCLAVDNLCDAEDGTSRIVLFKGDSTTTVGANWRFTGKIYVQDGAWVNYSYTLGRDPSSLVRDYICVRGWNCALNPRDDYAFGTDGNMGITLENEYTSLYIHPRGGTDEKPANVFWGPVSGLGRIVFPKNGSVNFAAPDNTFAGVLAFESTGDGEQTIIIGGDDRFSWGEGGTIEFGGAAEWKKQQTLVLNVPFDAHFYSTVISGDAGDRIVKRGAGTLVLADKNAFKGGSAEPDVVTEAGQIQYRTLYPDSSSMIFAGELGPSASWGYYSDNDNANAYAVTNDNGSITMVLNDGNAGTEYNAGTVQSPEWVNVKDAWNMHFTASLASESAAEQRECKFALVFHQGGNTGTIGLGSQWDRTKTLCWKDGSAGFFIGSGHWNRYLAFFTNGKMVGDTAVENDMFLFDNLEANPLVVDVAFDGGDKVAVKFTSGGNTLTVESAELASYLKTNFEGGAHIALTSYFGNCIETGMSVDNFAFNHSWTPIPTVSGDISLMGGTVSLVADGATNGVVSATMDFTGATTLVSEGDATFDFTSDKWSFNFNGGTNPKITFPASAKLPAAVTITINGAKANLPRTWTPIADMSAISGDLAAFTLAEGYPSRYQLKVRNGVLCFRVANGLVIAFR